MKPGPPPAPEDRSRLRRFSRAALDLIMPRSCVHCGGACSEAPGQAALDFLCEACTRELHVCQPPACRTCGFPYFGAVEGERGCPHCEDLKPLYTRGKALILAKGPGRALLHELKYHRGFYILHDFERLIRATPHYADYLTGAALVPVPLHPDKQRERGFNQSEKIAAALARASGGQARVEPLLERIRFTETQTRLDRAARRRNMKNAFALTPDAVLIPDQIYILVDDVFTTGATLNACAGVLRAAGAARVKVAVIGHG